VIPNAAKSVTSFMVVSLRGKCVWEIKYQARARLGNSDCVRMGGR